MTTCDLCKGTGLVSTGSVAHDVGTGRTETCPTCNGTGQESSAPQAKLPQEGDPCLDQNDVSGTLHQTETGWVCITDAA